MPGVRPEDVDLVIDTHLHQDHIGWNTMWEDGAWRPTFPNATHLPPRTEADPLSAMAEDPDRPDPLGRIRSGGFAPGGPPTVAGSRDRASRVRWLRAGAPQVRPGWPQGCGSGRTPPGSSWGRRPAGR
ncbi:MBL fold metallo-hydrolase [Streptomyces liangshanensis]|uniref:MBL fold metallo-hydrolase n=1 Tax=Streptomyces liangshanensis TaxID=2717324 RepID=UPI0036DBD03C